MPQANSRPPPSAVEEGSGSNQPALVGAALSVLASAWQRLRRGREGVPTPLGVALALWRLGGPPTASPRGAKEPLDRIDVSQKEATTHSARDFTSRIVEDAPDVR